MSVTDAAQNILRSMIGADITRREGPAWRAVSELADGAALAGIDGLAGIADPEARLAALAEMMGLPLNPEPAPDPASIEILLDAIQQAGPAQPVPGEPVAVQPAPAGAPPGFVVVGGPDLGAATPLTLEIGTTEPARYMTYSLYLRMTKVTRVRLTDPVDDADEIRITAGTAYGNGGTDRASGWRRDFAPNNPPESTATEDVATSHKLAECVIPQVKYAEYVTTIVVTEQDLVSANVADKLGTVLSLLLTAGVASAIRFLGAHGLPTDLAKASRDLLVQEGIQGSRDWFERLIGPELFELIVAKATTEWPDTSKHPKVTGWLPLRPFPKATKPASISKPGKLDAAEPIAVKEVQLTRDQDGKIQFDVLEGKGQYKITLNWEMVGFGAV